MRDDASEERTEDKGGGQRRSDRSAYKSRLIDGTDFHERNLREAVHAGRADALKRAANDAGFASAYSHIRTVARVRCHVQCSHVLGERASQGEAYEQDPRQDQHVAAAIYVAEFGDSDGKTCRRKMVMSLHCSGQGQGKNVRRTHVCQKVCQNDPWRVDKVVQLVRYGDECRGYDGGVEAGKQQADQKPREPSVP